MSADRRHVKRAVQSFRSQVCPDCFRRLTVNHYRDTGDVKECPEGACPVLFNKRNGNVSSTSSAPALSAID